MLMFLNQTTSVLRKPGCLWVWWLSFLSTVNHVFPLQLRPLICMAVSSIEIMKQMRPNILLFQLEMGFPCGSDYKESSCNAGNLGWEDPLEKGTASHSSILAWRISWTQKPGGLQSTRSQSQTWLSDFHFFFTFFKVRKATTNADLLPQLVHRYEQVTLEILLFRFKGISKVKICCCSVIQSCLTLCNPMDCSTPDFPVLSYLPEFAQTHVHWVSDIIKLSQSLSPHSPLALNLSQHQGLFQWVVSFGSGSQNIGASALSSVFPMNQFSSVQLLSPVHSNEYSALISFRIDWFDLLAV